MGSFIWKLIDTQAKHNSLLAYASLRTNRLKTFLFPFRRKIRYIFDGGLVDLNYDSVTYRGQSDYYRRPLVETFGYGVYYTISQLMSRLGALRESDFHLDLQRYESKESLNLLSVSGTTTFDGLRIDRHDFSSVSVRRVSMLTSVTMESPVTRRMKIFKRNYEFIC